MLPTKDNAAKTQRKLNPETAGFYYTLCSAICYTVSFCFMRGLTDAHISPYWSLTLKELTCVVCVLPVIMFMAFRGKYQFPKKSVFWTLIAAGFLCETLGAIQHFQAYEYIGMARTTPLLSAGQLLFASVVCALLLKERVSPSKIVAIVLSIAAVFLLGQSGGTDESIAGKQIRLGLGILCTACAALGYSLQLALIRRVLRTETPSDSTDNSNAVKTNDLARTPTSLVLVTGAGVGVVVIGLLFTLREGVGAWLEPPAICWKYVVFAGITNMFGFLFQIESLRRLFVLKQNLMASCQTILLCVLGVLMFGEPFGLVTALGIALVVASVGISGMSK